MCQRIASRARCVRGRGACARAVARGPPMAGPGSEPAKAEPCGLQPHPFDRSGIPPGKATSLATAGWTERLTRVDLELRVLGASQSHCRGSLASTRGNQPAASAPDEHEQLVVPSRVEVLHNTAPTPVSPTRANGHLPPVLPERTRG